MKMNFHRVLYLFAFVVLLIISCSKNKETTSILETGNLKQDVKTVMTQSAEINKMSFSQFKNYSLGFRKLAFKEMNAQNKARIWKERIASIIKDEEVQLRREGLVALSELITDKIFYNSTMPNEIHQWMKNNAEVFKYTEVKKILMTMRTVNVNKAHSVKDTTILQNVEEEGGGNGCTCNQADDFCASSYDCVGGTGCTRTESGCGWLWLGECNGRCRRV